MEAPEDLRYLKHLYISTGKLVTAHTKEKPTALLEEEFLYYTETRIPLLLEWFDTLISFTQQRGQSTVIMPSDIRILIGAWEFLKVIVANNHFDLLEHVWRMYRHFGFSDSEHDQYSWHLCAIIYHWITEGIREGVIPPAPFNKYNRYLVKTDVFNDEEIEDNEERAIESVCLQLKNLKCFLNFSAEEGTALLRHKLKKLNRPVYLFRLSATIPGAIVMQFILPHTDLTKRNPVMNVRIGSGTAGGDNYNFFMSPIDYTTSCEAYIATYLAKEPSNVNSRPLRIEMVQLKPTLKQMVGQTDAYVRYFASNEKTIIPLKSTYILY